MPSPRSVSDLARLGAGGTSTVARALERRAPRASPPSAASGAGDVERGDQVLAFAHEALVLADADEHVEVAGGARRARRRDRGRRARMRWPSAIPAGTSTSSSCAARHAARGRGTRRTACSGTRPSPPQTSQTTVRTIWPNGVRVDRLQLAGAAAALAGLDRRARLGAVAVAVLAALDRLVGDLDRRAARGLEQVDLDGRRATSPPGAGPRAPPKRATGAAAEERVEQVADRAEGVEVRRVAAGAQALVAVAVIGRAPLGVGEDLVRLGRLLELLLGLRVVRR